MKFDINVFLNNREMFQNINPDDTGGPTVASKPIFMPVEFAISGPPLGQQWFLFKMAVRNNKGFLGNLEKIYS